jgi:hypothetical protein
MYFRQILQRFIAAIYCSANNLPVATFAAT